MATTGDVRSVNRQTVRGGTGGYGTASPRDITTTRPSAVDQISISNNARNKTIANILKDWGDRAAGQFQNPASLFESGARLGSKLAEASRVYDQAFHKMASRLENQSMTAAELIKSKTGGIVSPNGAINSYKLLQNIAKSINVDTFNPESIKPDIENVIGELKTYNSASHSGKFGV